MTHRHGKNTADDDVRRIAHLFALRGGGLNEHEVSLVTRCSTSALKALVADGTISPPSAGRYAWNDAAYIAAHVQWTPRYVANALTLSRLAAAVPKANRYARVEYELPSYLHALLNSRAVRMGRRHVSYAPSDVLERIVGDYFEGEMGTFPRRTASVVRAALDWPVAVDDD